MKRHLLRCRFVSSDEGKVTSREAFREVAKNGFQLCFQKFNGFWLKCIVDQGDYFEVLQSDASLEAGSRRAPKNWQWVTSACDDRHLLRVAVNDREASSRQLAARWSFATGVLLSALSSRRCLLKRGLRARVPLYRIPLTAKHRRLQWTHENRVWQADWHHVVFSDESRFNLRDHNGRIRVRRYTGERCLPKCVIERHSQLTPGVMIWGTIS
ncbi:transposable element Tc1 transposase [Trichonephila clavipes]|nr:transposable element Tc1 transposase [Trichonephila clavipes]